MKSTDDLRFAVRGFRLALAKTQTEFGALIGKSLPTIQRYELLVPPKGKILFTLESLAREKRFDEYAQTFRDAIRDELGVELPGAPAGSFPVPLDLLAPTPLPFGLVVPVPGTEQARIRHDSLRLLHERAKSRGRAGAVARKQLKLVDQALRPTVLEIQQVEERNQAVLDQGAAAARLRDSGMPPAQIARKLRIPKAKIERLLSHFEEEQK
jgi:hypothetical protein